MSDREHLSIGEVLALLQEEFPDVSISKIRFLESQGLIEPQRTPSGYRQFFDEDTARLRWILMEQRDNFLPLKIIKERLSAGEFDRWYADGAVVPGSVDDSQPTLFEPAPPPPARVTADEIEEIDEASEVIDVAEVAAELEVTDDVDDAMADAEVHSLADAARKRAAAIAEVPAEIPEPEFIDPAPEFADPTPVADELEEPEPEPVPAAEAPRPSAPDAAPEPPEPVANEPAPPPETELAVEATEAPPEPEPGVEATEAPPEPEPGVVEPAPTDPVVHDVMLAAARQAASSAQPPRRPDPVPPPLPAEPPPPPPPAASADGPLDAGPTSVSMTVEELSRSTGLTPAQLGELERYGLLHSRAVGPAVYYDGDAMVVAKLAAAFLRHGVEARHLRMYKTAAEREAGVFEQVVAPMVRRSDATSRREARERLVEMARLGEALHAALLRLTLRAYTDPH